MYRGSFSSQLRRTDQRNARAWADFNFDVCLPDANATFLVLVCVFYLQLERRRKQKVESIYRSSSQSSGLCLLEPFELLEEKMKEWQLLPACVSPWCQCCLASLPSLGPLSQLESWRNRIGGSSALKHQLGTSALKRSSRSVSNSMGRLWCLSLWCQSMPTQPS